MMKNSFIASILLFLFSLSAFAQNNIHRELTNLYEDLLSRKLLIRKEVARIIEEVETAQQVKEYNYFVASTLKSLPRMDISIDSKIYLKNRILKTKEAISSIKKAMTAPSTKPVIETQVTEPEVVVKAAPVVKPVEAPVPLIKPVATASKSETIKNEDNSFSIWFYIGLFLATIATPFAYNAYNEKRNASAPKIEKKHVRHYFSDKYNCLTNLNSIFFVANSESKIVWSTNQNIFSEGNTIYQLFDSLDDIGNNQFEAIKGSTTYLFERSEVKKTSKQKYYLYSVQNIESTKVANVNYHITNNAQCSDLQSIIQKNIESKNYLFQLAGITLELNLQSQLINDHMTKTLALAINNILLSTYLLIKDKPVQDKHIKIYCADDEEFNRISVRFVLRNFNMNSSDLQLTHIFDHQEETTIANILRRNDLMLAPLHSRTMVTNSTNTNGVKECEIDLSLKVVKSLSQQTQALI